MKEKNHWYGAKCLFLFDRPKERLYEERIVLIEAESFEQAILEAEQEALLYAEREGGIYCEYLNVYRINASELNSHSEVFSTIRSSPLGLDEYLDALGKLGEERAGKSFDKQSGSYLLDITYGVEPMTLGLAREVVAIADGTGCDYDAIARGLSSSNLDRVESYQLGKALYEKAKKFLSSGASDSQQK